MARLFGIEILLMLLTGLFAMTIIPMVLGYPPAWPLFIVGFLMALSFVGLYAMANLGGRRMPARVRLLLGVASFVAALWGHGALLAPLLFGLLLAGVAALWPHGQPRGEAAAWALYAYAFPLLGVRYLLVPLVQVNPLATLIALQAGALYLLLRGLFRIFMPTAAEGNAEAAPLLYRPVPDRIVGMVEGTTRRHARPWATRPDGTRDEGAISLLCNADDLPGVTAKVEQALTGHPFVVEKGSEAEGKVEIVVRPAPAGESPQH